MARPSKYTYRRLRRFFKVLRDGGSKTAACGYAGISMVTACEWDNTKPKFSNAVKRWTLKGESNLVGILTDIAKDGPIKSRLTAAMYLLNTVHGLKQQVAVENTGTVKHEHSHEVREAQKILNRFKPGAGRAVIRTLEQFKPDPN